jgi:hypothetical protein
VLHEAALVRVLLQVIVLAQSEDEKAEVVGIDVDDHIDGLKLRNKTTQISFLKKTERQSKSRKSKVDCVNINDHINHFQQTNDK